MVLFTFPNIHIEPVVKAVLNGHTSTVKCSVDLSILIGDIVLIPTALFRSHVEKQVADLLE